MADYTVLFRRLRHWSVLFDHHAEVVSLHESQEDAITEARRLCAGSGGGRVAVHDESGELVDMEYHDGTGDEQVTRVDHALGAEGVNAGAGVES